eukprot:TRINITY_DN15491_c0_g1_i1.p1 TRINITY_DN15491_c0_g1~~TRINITY_DN15491_c0_g1_i1.p1  ORF type:complete len:184 (+),score=27.13 TRINITY_DN15491_c0_g1_i1:219-770(+)
MKIELGINQSLNKKNHKLHEESSIEEIKTYNELTHFSISNEFERVEEAVLPNLTCKRINPLSQQMDCHFFKSALDKQPTFEKVEFFQITNRTENDTKLATERVFIAAKECMGFIESSRPVLQENKESLTSIMDLMDEYGCEIAFACVKQEGQWINIVQSYLSIGFHLCNTVVLPKYLLLSQEF